MDVTCATCGLHYDDTYRLTFCPHDSFPMRAVVSSRGRTRVCTTVEQVKAFLRETDSC